MDNEYLDIIGLGIFKALNDKRYPILVNGKISESAIPTSITNSITSILSLIPDAASSENKLADKNFVNSSIATNTATFRGTFDDLATLQATSADINDYAFYVHTDEIGNTAYDRYKHNGNTWVFEYTLNNSSFTAEQWSAINSGITATKVGNYDAHLINYSNPHKVTKSQVGLGNVENVALSSWAGSNKITTLGTITTGVWNGTKITNTYLANSSITIGTTAISLGSTAKSLAGIEKLQLNDANSNLVYDSTTGSWKLTGNLLVTGFISAGAKGNSSSGGGSTYTQREWAEIKIMSASEIGLLASAYSVKEAYDELNAAIETLAGKATNVKFTQTLTSGKQIGSISIDGKSTSLYAPASYAWSEVTGKPAFATVATSGSYSDLTNKPTIASLMGSTAIGGTSSYLYWNGSAWATKALGTAAFAYSSDFAAASHTHSNYVDLTSQQTITGNKIFSGAIRVGAIGINTDNVGLYGYGEDAVEIHAENTLTLCGERNTYIGNADNSAMVDIQEDMAGYNAETGVETWYIYRDGSAQFQAISGELANSLAIKLNGGTTEGTNLFTFNNSASKTINITPSAIGAAAASHTHSYLPLSGGTLSGHLIMASPARIKMNGGIFEFNDSSGNTQKMLWAGMDSNTLSIWSNSNWYSILHSGNYNSYALPLSGGTMSNTSLVTNLNADLLDGYHSSSIMTANYANNTQDLNEISAPSIWRLSTSEPNLPSAYFNYGNLLHVIVPGFDTAWQLIGAYSSDRLWFRRGTWKSDGTGTLRTNAWKEIAFTDSNVASSSKWANARTITLTGSVTGSVSIDGSGDVSLATTTNHTHSYLPLSGGTLTGGPDVFVPLAIKNTNISEVWIQFQDSMGTTYIGSAHGVPSVYLGSGSNQTLIHSGNYNSYAPTLTGTGASGTWKINISGTADSASYASVLLTIRKPTTDTVKYDKPFSYFVGQPKIGTAEGNAYAGSSSNYNLLSFPPEGTTYDSEYANVMTLRLSWDKSKYWHDIFASPNTKFLWHRGVHNGTAYDWCRIVEEATDRTWNINISGNAATADTLAKTFAENINYAAYTTGLKLIRYDDNWEANGFPEKWTSGLSVMAGYCGWQLVTFGGSADTPYFRKVSDSGIWSNWRALAFTDSNVASATKLANSRTIWGQSFDGTGNVSGTLSGADAIELRGSTPFIDFHYGNTTTDYTSRIIEGLSGQLTVTGKLRVGLNYTTSTDYNLHIVGTAYASKGLVSDGYISAASTSTSSDIRLKENISEIGSKKALNWLLMLKPKSWTWNDKAGVKGASMGFVAQEVEGILPQMVKKQDNGYLSLDYTQLHALEVAGLQDHEKRIEELERENKILKEEINKLKQYAN